jgi:hypothetical protein
VPSVALQPSGPKHPWRAARPQAGADVTAAGCTPGYPWWYLLSTYNTQYVIGQTRPWASGQTGWMSTKSTHESSIQYGVSATGKTGSWSAGGSYSENDGASITMTFAENTAFRDYTVREQYGKYAQAYCGTTNYTSWKEYPIQPTGTYSYLASSGAAHFQSKYCDTQAAGTWNRGTTTGGSFSLLAGVKLQSVIGIDLKSTSSWSTGHDMFYKLTRNGTLCGYDALPKSASRVEAK